MWQAEEFGSKGPPPFSPFPIQTKTILTAMLFRHVTPWAYNALYAPENQIASLKITADSDIILKSGVENGWQKVEQENLHLKRKASQLQISALH